MKKLLVSRLSAGTVFRIVVLGLLLGFAPLTLLLGVLASLDLVSVSLNDEPMHGLTALLITPILGTFTAVFMAVSIAPFAFIGLWLFSKWNFLSVIYVPIVPAQVPVEAREPHASFLVHACWGTALVVLAVLAAYVSGTFVREAIMGAAMEASVTRIEILDHLTEDLRNKPTSGLLRALRNAELSAVRDSIEVVEDGIFPSFINSERIDRTRTFLEAQGLSVEVSNGEE